MIKELFLYSIFGTGLLLSPVLELFIFVQSRLLDSNLKISGYKKSDLDPTKPENRPDIEVMPVCYNLFPSYAIPSSKS